jgi:ubiquinone/menaquinone biosynthesis C-methylase UbiE
MPVQSDVSRHYTHGALVQAIRDGIVSAGKTMEAVTVDDLAPIDEFHIGGRRASEEFLDQLGFSSSMNILDVGCGLGGPARFVASRYGCRVTGIDLTAEYVETANVLCNWVKLEQCVSLRQGSALAMPFAERSFDGAYMLHVGMNIEDKEKLATEVARVLRPHSVFGIYDVMRTGPGDLDYPVPWATTPALSAVTEPERYRAALQSAGFAVIAERNRREFALEFFAELRARAAAAAGPPSLGLHVLMGSSAPAKVQNMIENISRGCIAPIELIARKN